MKKLQDAVENVKYGSVLTINKDIYNPNNNKYCGCISLYDGRILTDVKSVRLGDFLKLVPNISNELDQGYTYQVKYLSEERKYQSSIMYCVRKGGYKEPNSYETVKNFEFISDSFLDSIIELDSKIANVNYVEEQLKKERKIAIA